MRFRCCHGLKHWLALQVAEIGNALGFNGWWLSLKDKAEEDVWRWGSGEVMQFSVWRPNEPNDAGSGEDCAEVHDSAWNDLPCTEFKKYVCQFDKKPAEGGA